MIILHSLFGPELLPGTRHKHFQRFDKICFLIEIQIIAGFDRISGIQFTSEHKIVMSIRNMWKY